MAIPETVKFKQISTTTTGANHMNGVQFKLQLGIDEVAELLQIRVCFFAAAALDVNIIWVLYRKSLPTVLVAQDIGLGTTFQFAKKTDICAVGSIHIYTGAAGAGGYGDRCHDDFVFPRPMIVTRDPVLWTRNILGTTVPYGAILYYKIHKASEQELTRLMAKDHA